MAASAKRRKAAPEADGLLTQGASAVSRFVSNNPTAVAGSTAFTVALLYVSANALWYQPHAHTEPLFATRAFETFVSEEHRRELALPTTTISIERSEESPPPRLNDPVVEKVQQILHDLNFYAGDVDGIKGPNTRQAIETYQRKMGLSPSGDIDQQLLDQLGANETTGAITPSPRPKKSVDDILRDSAVDSGETQVVFKIQTGLRALGYDGIEADGILGSRTKAGIKAFQSKYGLPPTGEPDEAVYAKMRQAKLTD